MVKAVALCNDPNNLSHWNVKLNLGWVACAAGHDVLLIDAWMDVLNPAQAQSRLAAFYEDFLITPITPFHLLRLCPCACATLNDSSFPVEQHHHLHLHHIFPGNSAHHLQLKTLLRNKIRERELPALIAEINQPIARRVDYIYFIDTFFEVGKNVQVLLKEIARRPPPLASRRISISGTKNRSSSSHARIAFRSNAESSPSQMKDEPQ